MHYLKGRGVSMCPEKAVHYFEQSTRGGHVGTRDFLRDAMCARGKLGWTIKRHRSLRNEYNFQIVVTVLLCHARAAVASKYSHLALPLEMWLLILEQLQLRDLDAAVPLNSVA
eukprot:m.483507 g.483507  ORF g.483507 m.483507 type:complete len:113 (+) comp65082_c0_seq1:836-1174(+)